MSASCDLGQARAQAAKALARECAAETLAKFLRAGFPAAVVAIGVVDAAAGEIAKATAEHRP